MFRRKPTDEEIKLLEAITRVMDEMATLDPESDEYTVLLAKLERLMNLKPDTGKREVSRDALIAAGAQLAGILTIVVYESKHVLTSKAMSLITRSKT